MQITVNGSQFDVQTEFVSYEDIALLAGKPGNTTLTVVYSARPRGDAHRAGTLIPGRSIDVQDGMKFDAVFTGNA